VARVAVIGGGPMGLAAAYRLLQSGHQVDLYEADTVLGGMSASFDFDGIQIERFYHFICKGDEDYFRLLEQLGIDKELRWVDTYMGYFHEGEQKDWGDPFSLLRFSGLDLISKIRYGLMAFYSTVRRDWSKLDGVDAVTWLRKWVGQRCYDQMWRQLFELKFHHFTDNLSAAWIWARMRRTGTSRKNLLQEQLGYLQGGSQLFIDTIAAAIQAQGGTIHLGCPVDEVVIEAGRATGVRCQSEHTQFDGIISTIPLPYVPQMIPALAPEVLATYRALENIAVVCALVKLSRPLSKYFWMNISDSAVPIPGVIEYSNLCPLAQPVLYVPYYLPADHPDYQQNNAWFVERTRACLKQLDPQLTDAEILTVQVGRYRYAQPICPPEFLHGLPPIQPGVEALWVADTSYYYPEDRSISESVKLGAALGTLLEQGLDH
jgi:protoporphyrinogen oxidase